MGHTGRRERVLYIYIFIGLGYVGFRLFCKRLPRAREEISHLLVKMLGKLCHSLLYFALNSCYLIYFG